MTSERADVGLGVWLQWVLASAVGLAAGTALSSAVRVALGPEELAGLEEADLYGMAAAAAARAALVASIGDRRSRDTR